MNKCSVGDIIFGWFIGIRNKKVGEYERDGLLIETGEVMGNKGKLPEGEYNRSELKLLEFIIRKSDIEEIKEGLEKIYKYYSMEFNEEELKVDKMISSFKEEYEKDSYKSCRVYVKWMTCVGCEIMHSGDMDKIINLNSFQNDKINKLGSCFLVIKLMEKNFLKKFMKNGYRKLSDKKKKFLLECNSLRLVIPISQLEEILKSF